MAVRFADGLAYGMWAAGGRQRGHLRKKGLQTGLMAAPRPRKQAGIDGLWPEAAYCRVIAAYGPLESAVLTRPQDPGDGMLTASPGPEDGSETGLGLRRLIQYLKGQKGATFDKSNEAGDGPEKVFESQMKLYILVDLSQFNRDGKKVVFTISYLKRYSN
ncbi:hypothetical protein DFH28DRAFT_927204 [Melampsora americana]|nr:hypothetical protein DFH28DRAFT_927204 [Melampsora americana]